MNSCNGLPRPSSFSYPVTSTSELEEEILTLEIEILRLECHILSLYRAAFVEHLSTSLPSTPSNHSRYKTKPLPLPVADVQLPHEWNRLASQHHDQSSPANDLSISSSRSSSSIFSKETPAKEKRSYHSKHRSLAEHFGVASVDDIYTPDRLSEEIVRCISSVYRKLADARHGQSALSPSPTLSFSSSSIFSSKSPHDNWSPCNEELAVSNRSEGMRGASDSHADTTEILRIRAEGDSFYYATQMLQSLRSMVQKLEMVDPRRMRREEKLAFWINIHNALVMHAYLAYGTQNRANSGTVLKASYNVGGHRVDAYMIQSCILGIRPHVSAPRLQTLFSSGKKYKRASAKHEYALEYPEPLVHFAVCSWTYSDPAVRVYRAENIFHDLQIAKEEYIRASVFIKKDRIIVPKIVYYFLKDMSLDVREIWDMVGKCMPEEARKDSRTDKGIHWSAQCSTFRFVIHGGPVKER